MNCTTRLLAVSALALSAGLHVSPAAAHGGGGRGGMIGDRLALQTLIPSDADRDRHHRHESTERQARLAAEITSLEQRAAQLKHEEIVLFRMGTLDPAVKTRLAREITEIQERITRLQGERYRQL